MFAKFQPDAYFEKISDITEEYLKEHDIKGLIMDIDNTLVPYTEPYPDEYARSFLSGMQTAGIKVVFLSNNSEERVSRFNEDLGYMYFAKSTKPYTKDVKKAVNYLGLDKKNVAMIGDQLLTDVHAAKLNGIFAIAVAPIQSRETLFFRFKRAIERPIYREYFKKTGEKK